MPRSDDRAPSSSVNGLLAGVIAALVIAILVGVIVVIWYASLLGGAPRTEPERRVTVYEVAVDEQPEEPLSWAGLMLAYADVDRFADAEAVFARYSEYAAASLHPSVLIAYADVAFAQGEYATALERFEIAREASVEMEDKAREENEARGISFEFVADANIASTIGIARSHEALGDLDQALDYYDLVLEMDPLMADILVERAAVLEALGRTDEARNDYEQALRLDPSLTSAREGLAGIEE